mmetsp:Transcript_40043/g.96022  ORF Transcript_40043/g.96022 Transcript_40043/m.96022 type:complete len:277 (-) Transcript_40043:1543-2373(-)
MLGAGDDHSVGYTSPVVVPEVEEHLVFPAELQLRALVVHPDCAPRVPQHVPHDALVAVGDVRLFGVVRSVAVHLLDKRRHACVGGVNVESAVAPHAVNVRLPHAQLGKKIPPGQLPKIVTAVHVVVRVLQLRIRLSDLLHHHSLPLSHSDRLAVGPDLLRHVGMRSIRVLPLVVEPIEVRIAHLPGVHGHILHSVPSHQLLHPRVPSAKVSGVPKLLELGGVHGAKPILPLVVVIECLNVSAILRRHFQQHCAFRLHNSRGAWDLHGCFEGSGKRG